MPVKIWATCKNVLGKWITAPRPPSNKLPVRLCAARHVKSFVPVSVFFKVSVDHLFDNLESGKRNYCFGKSLEFWMKNLYEP